MPATGYTDTADKCQKKERGCGRNGPAGTKKRECARQIPELEENTANLEPLIGASKRKGGKKKVNQTGLENKQ